MRKITEICLILLTLMALGTISFGQVKSKVYNYSLRVESADNPNSRVSFTAAYFFGDSTKVPLLTTVERETPFVLDFSAQYFLGMFQGKDVKKTIKVSLFVVENGTRVGNVEGQSAVNVVRAEGGSVAYGLSSLSRESRSR